MATATKERVISLWLDDDYIRGAMCEEDLNGNMWIVSEEEWTREGNKWHDCHSFTLVETFTEDDYDVAKEAAINLAKQEGRRVLRSNRYGKQKIIFDPACEHKIIFDPPDDWGYSARRRRLAHEAHKQKRSERMRGGRFTREDWKIALEFFGHRCAFCGSEGPLHQEHFFPLGYDGPHTAGNIVPACATCNESKGTRDPKSWCSPEVYRRIVDFLATRPGWPGEIDRVRILGRRIAEGIQAAARRRTNLRRLSGAKRKELAMAKTTRYTKTVAETTLNGARYMAAGITAADGSPCVTTDFAEAKDYRDGEPVPAGYRRRRISRTVRRGSGPIEASTSPAPGEGYPRRTGGQAPCRP
jgi:hypothetical protein